MEWKTNMKQYGLIGLGVIVVVALIVVFVFRDAKPANAPTVDSENVATTSPLLATTTASQQDALMVSGTMPSVVTPTPTTNTGVQVIHGDGFTATIKPVTPTGDTPIISSFTVQQKQTGCVYAWETRKAVSCDILNTTDKTSVKNVPVDGTLQTSDAGGYQLSCVGDGGIITRSEVVVCK